jgi:hypothetical protein
MRIRRRLKRRIPNWCLDKKYRPLQHDVDDYSSWTDRSVPTPELDKDPRTAFDALDPDKPRGM